MSSHKSSISIQDILTDAKKAAVIGIGSGADVVGTLPTAEFLDLFDVDAYIGGLSWERSIVDPQGPRGLEEIENIEKISNCFAIVNERTKTKDGVVFSETVVSRYIDRTVFLIDPTGGVVNLRKGLLSAAKKLDLDVLIGIDTGGDVLAKGNEKGLYTPLADGIMGATLAEIGENQINSILGIFGYGSDGELTSNELDIRFRELLSDQAYLGSWGLTPKVCSKMEEIIKHLESDANRLPLTFFRKGIKEARIRQNTRSVKCRPSMLTTFYFSPNSLLKTSPIMRKITNTYSIQEANSILKEMELPTEIELADKIKEKGIGTYLALHRF